MSLTLYVEHHWYSPWAFSAFVALKEKGLAFETVELDLSKKPTRVEPFLSKSVTGTIPVLVHDGHWVGESLAIAEYVAETFPYPTHPVRLFPADLRQRARARQVMTWLRSDLLPLRQERSTHTMFYGGAKPLSAAAKASMEELLRVANLLIRDGQPNLFEQWCLADADLAFCLQRLGLNGHELPKKIRDYVEAQWSRPSVQAYVNHPRPA